MVSVNFEIRFEKALFKKVFISFESLGKILFKLLLIEFLKFKKMSVNFEEKSVILVIDLVKLEITK